MIVDPGAWTNLIGKLLARRLIQRAIAAGHKPRQEKIPAIHIAGVGNGQQQCENIAFFVKQRIFHKL